MDDTQSQGNELFMSRGKHLEFRGLTKLLSMLDRELQREEGDSLSLESITSDKGIHGSLYEFLHATHVNLLPRDNEVVALVVAGKPQGISEHGQITVIDNSRMSIVANPRLDEHKYLNPKATSSTLPAPIPSPRVVVSKMSPQNQLTDDTDIVAYLVAEYTKVKEAGGKLKEPLFTQHVSCYMQLLGACHQATEQVSHKVAVDRFTTYVYCTSHPKMLKRLKYGKKDKNYFEIMTAHPKSLSESDWSYPVPNEIRNLRPNKAQSKFLGSFWRTRTMPNGLHKIQSQKLYDEPQARKIFHIMLLELLIGAQQSLEALESPKEAHIMTKLTVQDITQRVDKAIKSLRSLEYFIKTFAELLPHHFKLLAAAAGVTNGRQKADWSTPNAAPQGTVSLPVQDSKTEAVGKDELEDQEGADAQTAAETTADELDELAALSLEHGWPAAGIKYLKLICLHQTSLLRATQFDPGNKTKARQRESDHIANSGVGVVEIQAGTWDSALTSVEECCKKLCASNSSLDYAQIYKWYVVDREWGDFRKTGNFTGTSHCEAILMSLMALAKDRAISSLITDGELRQNGLFAVKDDLLAMFKDPIPLVHVSKRCCPACQLVRKLMSDLRLIPQQIVAPGYHTKWSMVSLPMFMPKTLAEKCLDHVREEAVDKLQKLQKKLDREKKEGSEKGDSDPATNEDTVYDTWGYYEPSEGEEIGARTVSGIYEDLFSDDKKEKKAEGDDGDKDNKPEGTESAATAPTTSGAGSPAAIVPPQQAAFVPPTQQERARSPKRTHQERESEDQAGGMHESEQKKTKGTD